MLLALDGSTLPPPPPKPPAPTPVQLSHATPAQATAAVQNMTPQDRQTFKSEVENMPQAGRQNLANNLAAKLPVAELVSLESIFGKDDIAHAVQTYGSPKLQTDYKIAHLSDDPTLKAGLAKLGLTPDQVSAASDQVAPQLLDAAQAAVSNHYDKALSDLQAAAKAGCKPAITAFAKAASQDPGLAGPAKTILSDSSVAGPLIDSAPDTVSKLISGDFAGAVQSLAGNAKLRDSVLAAAAKDPTVIANLKAIGLTPEDLAKAGNAAPGLINAGSAAAQGHWSDAVAALAGAAKEDPALVAKGIQAAGCHLSGLPKALLTNPKVASELAQSGATAINAFAQGNLAVGLQAIGGNTALRNDVIDVIAADPSIKPQLDKLGISTKDLQQSADALPDLVDAAQAFAAGKPADAITALCHAAAAAPALAQKAINALGKQLPPGFAHDLLTDSAFSSQLVSDPTLQSAITQLVNDPGKALDSLGSLLNDDQARSTVLAVAGKNPDIIKALQAVGLSPADLQQAGTAAPHVLNAMQAAAGGDYQTALTELKAVGNAAPDLLQKIGKAIYAKLPAPIKSQLSKLHISEAQIIQSASALPDLVDAATAIGSNPPNWRGALDSLMAAGEAAPELAQSAIQALGNNLPSSMGLLKKLLTDPQVSLQLASDTSLHQGIDDLLDGKTLQGASELLHDDSMRNAVLTAISQDPTVSKALAKLGMTPADLVQAGAASPYLLDAAVALAGGKWPDAVTDLGKAADASPGLLQKVSAKLVELMPASVSSKLASLGLTTQDLQEAGAALPDFINAIDKASQHDYLGALQALAAATHNAPDLVAKAIKFVAGKLPDTPKTQLLKSMLSDQDLVQTLLSDSNLQTSLGQLLSGDVAGGLKGIANDTIAMSQLADVLAKDPKIMQRLAPLGVSDAADIVALGPSLADAVDLADAIGKGDIGDVIQKFGALAQHLPPDMRDKVINGIVSKFHLKPEFKDLIAGSIEALADPKVATALGQALKSFESGNPIDFIKAIANVGETISNDEPGLAVDFLDALSHLPGSVGNFFSSHELNQDIVQSGSLSKIFDAVQKMASGDIGGALDDLGDAIGKLITEGPHFQTKQWSVGWGFATAHFGPYSLPFGQQGVDAMGLLIGQFVDAMPPQVKNFMEQKAVSAVANAGLQSIPVVGPIYGMVKSGANLVSDISDHKNGLSIGLDAANLLVSGADLIPGLSVATEPLRTLIGVGQAVNDTIQFVSGINNFGQQFAGM